MWVAFGNLEQFPMSNGDERELLDESKLEMHTEETACVENPFKTFYCEEEQKNGAITRDLWWRKNVPIFLHMGDYRICLIAVGLFQ